nr:LOW QUALITY PROTEIN: caspase-12-like [Loxodonta africana]
MFMGRFFNPIKQLSLKYEDENEDSEREEKAGSAKALALPLTAPPETNDELMLCPPHYFQKVKTKRGNEIYPVVEKAGRTRLALIICNKELDHPSTRDGAEIDISGMQDVLENLGYLVVVKKNLSAQEMEEELRQFAARPEHKSSDSTFLVFMSHGILDGICGKKHSSQQPDILKDDTIFRIFNNSNCKNLKDKPKIIIMQACRGDNVSWKLHTNGSLFISQLVNCFKKYYYFHLEEVFRKDMKGTDFDIYLRDYCERK